MYLLQPSLQHNTEQVITCSKAKEEDHINQEETQQISQNSLKHKSGGSTILYLT